MKAQPQGHAIHNPYHQDDIKPDAMLMNNAISSSQHQHGYNKFYSERDALKQLPEASSWPKLSGTGKYDCMELIDCIDKLFIDVPSIPDYWIIVILHIKFKGYSSIWYTEMKEIHGRRNRPSWKSQIIQKYSIDEESQTPYKNATRTRACSSLQMQLEHAVHYRCNPNCTLDDIANTLQDLRKRTNIGKYTLYESSGFTEKQPFRVEFKDKPRKRVAEVEKKKNSFHNCGSKDHYANNCPKEKKKLYAINKVPERESPTKDSESDSMSDAIRE
ncbi:hypothetical protein O181_086400 [Austropuccinia psidii MF-1]|uniref:CCHC-type domain-containing protein n=1 Tax=Austropuccinia psidii MF-1 TaxID=1389203 RepID=A0A9Q3IN98_9BASI|nr:hypothetical protein [Austropuccinia psidii MF-1]